MALIRRALLLLPLLGGAALAQTGTAPRPRPQLAAGIQPLPGGGWRLTFARDEERATPEQRLTLMELGNILAAETAGRVTLWSEVTSGEEDASEARRLALRRALAVREALVVGGLPETRVDLRALGRTESRRDVVDILPPGVVRP